MGRRIQPTASHHCIAARLRCHWFQQPSKYRQSPLYCRFDVFTEPAVRPRVIRCEICLGSGAVIHGRIFLVLGFLVGAEPAFEGSGLDFPDANVRSVRRRDRILAVGADIDRLTQIAEGTEVADNLAAGDVPQNGMALAGDEALAIGGEGNVENRIERMDVKGLNFFLCREIVDHRRLPEAHSNFGSITRKRDGGRLVIASA